MQNLNKKSQLLSTGEIAYSNDQSEQTSSVSLSQYYPWIIILLCAAFSVYKFVLQVSPSVMTSQLMSAFHVNGAGLGNLAATYFYSYLVAQLFAGPLLDHYSPRLITATAIGMCAAGAALFASTEILFVAEVARILIGIGAAFVTVSYMKMTSIWFKPNQIAFVDGLLATAAMTGALCGQVPLAYLVANHGWQETVVYCSVAGFILAFLFIAIVRDKRPAISLVGTKEKFVSAINLKEFVMLAKKRENWILALYSGLAFTPLSVLGGLWGNPFLTETYHLTLTQAASYTSLIFLGLAFGAPAFGFFADPVRRMRMMQIGTTISLIALTIIIAATALPHWLLGSLLFIFGFGTGSFMSCFALGKTLNDIKFTATVIALINTGDALLGSFTEPLIGKILDFNWTGEVVNGVHHFTANNFRCAFLILPLYILGALICLYKFGNKGEQPLK